MPPGTYQAHWVGCTARKVSTSLRWNTNFALGKNGARGSFSPSTASVVPIVMRRSCTWRWSNETKSTAPGGRAQRRRPVPARPRGLRLVELVDGTDPDLLRTLDGGHVFPPGGLPQGYRRAPVRPGARGSSLTVRELLRAGGGDPGPARALV